MLKDFKAFITRGSVVDLAVGVIIGAAFGRIVTSFVNDIIMPPIGLLLGGVNFTNLFVSLNGQHYNSLADAQTAGAPTINWGLFVNNIIDFVIVAFIIFLMIRAISRLMPPPPPPASDTQDCPYCLTKIAKGARRCPNCTSQLEPVSG